MPAPRHRRRRQAGYRGPITIEGNGTTAQIRTAFATLAAQARESI
jgi:hypothetical protein